VSGSNSAVECQLPKLDVAGSIPVSRSSLCQGFGWQAGVLAEAARRSFSEGWLPTLSIAFKSDSLELLIIFALLPMPESVTYVSGIFCNLCVGKLILPISASFMPLLHMFLVGLQISAWVIECVIKIQVDMMRLQIHN
jgi:hypothetical protein